MWSYRIIKISIPQQQLWQLHSKQQKSKPISWILWSFQPWYYVAMFLVVYKLYSDFYERLANRQSINETVRCLYRFGNGAARWMCGRVSATTVVSVVSEIMCVFLSATRDQRSCLMQFQGSNLMKVIHSCPFKMPVVKGRKYQTAITKYEWWTKDAYRTLPIVHILVAASRCQQQWVPIPLRYSLHPEYSPLQYSSPLVFMPWVFTPEYSSLDIPTPDTHPLTPWVLTSLAIPTPFPLGTHPQKRPGTRDTHSQKGPGTSDFSVCSEFRCPNSTEFC